MKKLWALAVAVAALGTAFAGPSRAAGPYTIAGPSAPFADGFTRFVLAGCDPSLDNGPTDGIDSQIVDVSGRGGTTLAVIWSANPEVAANFNGQLTAKFRSDSCAHVGEGTPVSKTPGRWDVPVPVGTRWLVVVSSMEAQVSFSFP